MRGFSLITRLTLFFTGAAAAVVLGLGWLFMVAADQHFAELDSIGLYDKQHLIEEVLTRADSVADARMGLQGALDHHHGLSAAVVSPLGAVLFQSHDFVAIGDALRVANPVEPSVVALSSSDGRALRVLRFHLAPAYDPAVPLEITLVMDTAHHAQFLSKLRNTLMVYAVLATVLSGGLGWLAAYQGLQPLRAMRRRAAAVSGNQLHERMPEQSVPVEMAELAAELNRMLDRLQQDFDRLQEFASDLAHELRTPISNLLTQTQVTLSSTRDNATYRDTLASNAEELQRLARMVSDMLFLAKTERGVDLPNKERFDVADDIRALGDFYEAVADEKKVTLDMQGQGVIDGDRLMFRRALSNLLSNALRHAPAGTEVRVCVTQTPQSTEVAVENNGPDIDPQALPRLFERFYRADPARAHTTEGAGLGLPITQAIMQAHAGHVTVESGAGRTVFRLVFPRR